jgi:hypothetical protein
LCEYEDISMTSTETVRLHRQIITRNRTMKKTRISLIIIPVLIAVQALAGQKEDQLYNAILKAVFTRDKNSNAGELARLGTADARAKLLTLLDDGSYWNREAAVFGIFALNDGCCGEALIGRLFKDHMIRDEVTEGFRTHIGPYFDFLVGRYRSEKESINRERIINIISRSGSPRGDGFLKSIIDDKNTIDRELAFKNLVRYYPANNYGYIKKYLDDPYYRTHALAFLAEKGTADDLKIFQEVLERKEQTRNRISAYRGVDRLGSDSLRNRVLLDALGEKEEALVQGAIFLFTGVKSDTIRDRLCRLVKKGSMQDTRMAAAMRLRDYETTAIVPALVISLGERFVPAERGGIDIFATIITLGLASISSDLSQKYQRTSFQEKQGEIAAHLKKITGADIGASYGAWLRWAIYNGYTVSGDNIIRHLFSGYRYTRETATESAMKLLGYPSSREFFATNGTYASDSDLALALAKMLIGKGYLKEDE